MSVKKRIVSGCLAMVCVLSSTSAIKASALLHTESLSYGFDVDLDNFKPVDWSNYKNTYVWFEGRKIGVCRTNIGLTRAKTKSYDNKYMDLFLIQCSMQGMLAENVPKWNDTDNGKRCGYSEYLDIYSRLPSTSTLKKYSPEQMATSNSYDIGIGYEGLSASVSFTKDALSIDTLVDKSKRWFELGYDYDHNHISLFGRWKFNKYSYYESVQRACFFSHTNSSRYNTWIDVEPKFEIWNEIPCSNANPVTRPGTYATGFGAVNIQKTPY